MVRGPEGQLAECYYYYYYYVKGMCMNNTVKSDFFGFPKEKWLHLTGEVDKCVRYSCQFFSGFNVAKTIKIG